MLRIPQVVGAILLLLSIGFISFLIIHPPELGRVAQAPLTPEELSFLEEHPRIVLGIDKKWEPNVIVHQDGIIEGYDVDLLNAINRHTGANFVLQLGNWSELVEKAKNREIDGLACSAAIAQRKEHFNFSESYNHVLPMVLVHKKNPLSITKWEDLNGKRIVIQKGIKFQEKLAEKLTDATIIPVDSLEETILAVIRRKADATFGFGAFMYYHGAGKLDISKIQFAFSMKKIDLVYSIRKDWPLALSILNKGLKAISHHEQDQIFNKWYGVLGKNHFSFVQFLELALPLALVVTTLLALYFRKVNQRLLAVQDELKGDIAKRISAQEKLDWELRVNKAIAGLSNALISPEQNMDEIATKVLSFARELTRSQYGFVSEIDRTTFDNKIYCLNGFGDSCKIENSSKNFIFPRGENGLYPGLWGHALNTGEPFFTNSPAGHSASKGLPEGHVPLNRFLSMPVKYGGTVVGQIALANTPAEYVAAHIAAVQQLADLYALAIHRRRSHEDSLLVEAQLHQAQKMESLGTLAGGIAHDFNNILSTIIGYSELAIEDAAAGKTNHQKTQLAEILNAGERAKDLVTQILTFSRKMEPELKPINLNQVIRETSKMLERTFPKMISIEQNLLPDLWMVKANIGNIAQILMNLFTNALDAMPDGGRLVIETDNVTLDPEYTRPFAEMVPGKYVQLTVSDTGWGMDTQTMDQIFDPFFTSKEVGKGTGLGLSTVYGIVKSHGGHIICRSKQGQGSSFIIFLPVITSGIFPEKTEETDTDDFRGMEETILLVDDEAPIRHLGNKVLTRGGYRVVLADCGENALSIYREQGDEIDLVILDISMPGMGGHKCLKELLLLNPEIKILISSGYSLSGHLNDSLDNGAAGFMPKPFGSMDMLKKVREVLDR